MKSRLITCPMCGTQFDPSEHAACRSCPLQLGCQLVCCPVCGYETVDTGKSVLARLAGRLMPGKARWRTTLDQSDKNGLEV